MRLDLTPVCNVLIMQIMSSKLKQMVLRAPAVEVAIWDEEARIRNMTRSAFFTYMVRAFEREQIMIADWSTWGKWEQLQRDRAERAARVAAREEVKLYLHEQGFTSGPYEK